MKDKSKIRDMKGVKTGRGSAGRANYNARRRERRKSASNAVRGLEKGGGFTWDLFRERCDEFMTSRGLPVFSMREYLESDTQRRFEAMEAKGI